MKKNFSVFHVDVMQNSVVSTTTNLEHFAKWAEFQYFCAIPL